MLCVGNAEIDSNFLASKVSKNVFEELVKIPIPDPYSLEALIYYIQLEAQECAF